MSERTVWKFPLQIDDVQGVLMPSGAKILYVAVQDGVLCLWALVDPDAAKTIRTFLIVGTGHPAPTDAEHVGSGISHGGNLVWHVFEDVPF